MIYKIIAYLVIIALSLFAFYQFVQLIKACVDKVKNKRKSKERSDT